MLENFFKKFSINDDDKKMSFKSFYMSNNFILKITPAHTTIHIHMPIL